MAELDRIFKRELSKLNREEEREDASGEGDDGEPASPEECADGGVPTSASGTVGRVLSVRIHSPVIVPRSSHPESKKPKCKSASWGKKEMFERLIKGTEKEDKRDKARQSGNEKRKMFSAKAPLSADSSGEEIARAAASSEPAKGDGVMSASLDSSLGYMSSTTSTATGGSRSGFKTARPSMSIHEEDNDQYSAIVRSPLGGGARR